MPGIPRETQGSVLEGFPSRVSGPLVWNNDDFVASPHQIINSIHADDILEFEHAKNYFKGLGLSPGFLSPQTFPLSEKLAGRLRDLSNIVHNGRGFATLRGLQPSKYSDEDNVIIYIGIASYVANERAGVLDHIRDRALMGSREDKLAPPDLAIRMSFHTDVDAGDVLSLYTQSVSADGGSQYLASFWKVYNVLADEHPGILKTLAAEWRWQLPNIHTGNLDVLYRPIIGCADDKVMINFAMTFLVGSDLYPLPTDAPPLTPKQRQALRVLLRVCQEQSVKLDPISGDMTFVNNLSVLHARDAYRDEPELGQSRHLLSIMLRDTSLASQKPECFGGRSNDVFGVPPEKQVLLTAGHGGSSGGPSPKPPPHPKKHD